MSAKRVHLFLLAFLLLPILPPTLRAQSENRAALVINYGDRVATHCVAFSEPQISGYELLVRAGRSVEVEAGGMGAAVCRLDGTGCPGDDCFCQCRGGGDCIYWSYWHRNGGAWQYSPVGASNYQVSDGAVDGWSWGPGSPDQAIPPPNLSFADVCAPAAATATSPPPTAVATATSLPPTATSAPSATTAPAVAFSADASSVVAGACTTLRWSVQHVNAVYLDGNGVMGQGEQRVCPATAQTYTLRAVHGGGETVRQVTVAVTAPTATASPTISALAETAAPTTSSAPTATSQPAHAAAAATTPSVTSTAPLPSATPSTAGVESEPVAPVAPPTSTPAPTVTAIVVTVPPLPTEAPAAAVAPVQPTAPAPTTPARSAAAPAGQTVPWLDYAGFVALVFVLGAALVVVQRGKEGG